MLPDAVTAWDAPLSDPRRAAAGLRAVAHRHDAPLREMAAVELTDLVAAVVAAQVLLVASGRVTLSAAAHRASRATGALARIGLRAAGNGLEVDLDDLALLGGSPSGEVAAQVERMLAWAAGHDAAVEQVAARAAYDLCAAECPRVRAAAACLAAHA